MIDWNQIILPLLPTLGAIALAAGTVVLGLFGVAKAKVALWEAKIKQSEAELSKLEQGRQTAEIAVKSVEQNPLVVSGLAKKEAAIDTVKKTVDDLGDHLPEHLVEAAVKDMKQKQVTFLPTLLSTSDNPIDEENAG